MPDGVISADGELLQTTDNEYITEWNGTDWSAFLHLNGTFGGGTVTVSFRGYGSTGAWLPINDGGTFTADADKQLWFPRKTTVKVTLSGATTPTINWSLV